LKPQCVAALSRIFRICDTGRDGLLDAAELNEFQVCISSLTFFPSLFDSPPPDANEEEADQPHRLDGTVFDLSESASPNRCNSKRSKASSERSQVMIRR
jgi:hypothetical protein